VRYLRAYLTGLADGWRSPVELVTSTNIDHLVEEGNRWDVHEAQDHGINLGQFLRAGRRSQAHREHGFPLHRR
jgi:hypothetical protein